MKKLLALTVKGLNELISVKFTLGVLAGAGMIAVMLGKSAGLF